jgi:transcriptional regulator with XRE-family HTH domain
MPDEDLVSYVLAALRAAHGLTQKEVADRTGFDKAQISRWETGREVPSVGLLSTLLTQLKTTPAEFFKLQSLLLRIIERPDSFSEGLEESLARHSRRDPDDDFPVSRPRPQSPRQVAEVRAGGWPRSSVEEPPASPPTPPARPAPGTVIEGIAEAMRERVGRGTGAAGVGDVDGGDEPEIGPLAQEVDVLAKETARLVESHVRLFYRALAGPTAAGRAAEDD